MTKVGRIDGRYGSGYASGWQRALMPRDGIGDVEIAVDEGDEIGEA